MQQKKPNTFFINTGKWYPSSQGMPLPFPCQVFFMYVETEFFSIRFSKPSWQSLSI